MCSVQLSEERKKGRKEERKKGRKEERKEGRKEERKKGTTNRFTLKLVLHLKKDIWRSTNQGFSLVAMEFHYFEDWTTGSVVGAIIILVTFVLLAIFILERWWHFGKLQRLGFTGPPPNLLLGTLKHFNEVSGEFPDGWQRMFDTYGSQVGDVKGKCLAMYMGRHPCIVVSDPDLIKAVAIKDFNNFRNRMFSNDSNKKGMIWARDETWRNTRHTLAPAFSQAKIKHMSHAMNKSLSLTFEIIEDHVREDEPIDFLKLYRGLTMEIICKCCLALEVNAQKEERHPLLLCAIKIFVDYGYNGFKRVLIALFPSISNMIIKYLGLDVSPNERAVLDYIKNLIQERMASSKLGKTADALYFMLEAAHLISVEDDDTVPTANGKTAKMNGHSITKSTYHEIHVNGFTKQRPTQNGIHLNENTSKCQSNESKTIGNDEKNLSPPLKDRKPKLSADDVASNGFLLLLAGYETTSAALTFSSYLLAKNPHVQQKLYEEISENIESEEDLTYEKVGQLQYLDMVINECLRCYPPAGNLVSREVDKDYEYKGLKFPAKSYVLIPIAYMHYNLDLWDDPNTFDPERFHPDRKKDIHPEAFMPFGVGPRRCMGARFAMLEIKLALTRLLRRFRLEVCHLTETELKTRTSLLILTPASGKLYLKCFQR